MSFPMGCRNKKLLVIAYHFPPDASVGALRPQKFVKYLPELGWEPCVLTIRERYIEKSDSSRLDDISGTTIHRTLFWRTPLQLALDTRDKLRGGKSNVAPKESDKTTAHVHRTNKPSLLSKIKNRFVAINWFPDDKLWWIIPSLIPGYKIIRKNTIHVIYATSPPATAALLGFILSKITGANLILDFRDPWVAAKETFSGRDLWPILGQFESRVEHALLRHATHVICTTGRYRNSLIRHYPDLPNDKFSTIVNGFDTDDFAAISPDERSKFTITYLGTFYLERTPEPLFIALSALFQGNENPSLDVEIRLIGNVAYVDGKCVREMAQKYGLADKTSILGFVSHLEAIRQMSSADLLLLLAPNQPNQIPAKAFEYIGARRPILALTGDGATADLIRETKSGLVANQNNPTEILNALKIFLRIHRSGEAPWYQGCDIRKYERRALTGQLATILNGAIGNQK